MVKTNDKTIYKNNYSPQRKSKTKNAKKLQLIESIAVSLLKNNELNYCFNLKITDRSNGYLPDSAP